MLQFVNCKADPGCGVTFGRLNLLVVWVTDEVLYYRYAPLNDKCSNCVNVAYMVGLVRVDLVELCSILVSAAPTAAHSVCNGIADP